MMDCCQDEEHVNVKRLNTLNIVEINDKNIQTKKGEVKIQTNLLKYYLMYRNIYTLCNT